MTRAKELLDAATPLPARWTWLYDSYDHGTVFITSDPVDGQAPPIAEMLDPTEAKKIVEAHNVTLPAYEAAVEALRGLVATFDEYDADGVGYGGFPVAAAREALRRLQEQTQ